MVVKLGASWRSGRAGGGILSPSSGGGPVTPATLGATLWLSSLDTEASLFQDNPPTIAATKSNSVTTGSSVEYLNDSSGNANHFKRVLVAASGFAPLWMEDTPISGTPATISGLPYYYRPSVNQGGNTGYTDCINTTAGDFNHDDPFTFALVWNVNSTGSFHRPYEKSDNTKGYGLFWTGSALQLYIGSNADGYVDVNYTTGWASDTWHAIVVRWSGSAYRLRTDGVDRTLSVTTNPTLTTAINNTAELSLGVRVASGSYTEEAYYSMSMWDSELSDDDVTSWEQDYVKPIFGLIP